MEASILYSTKPIGVFFSRAKAEEEHQKLLKLYPEIDYSIITMLIEDYKDVKFCVVFSDWKTSEKAKE